MTSSSWQPLPNRQARRTVAWGVYTDMNQKIFASNWFQVAHGILEAEEFAML